MSDDVKTWCPQCGPDVSVDEDGCCAVCGADATGDGADLAHAQRSHLEAYMALYETCERQRLELVRAIREGIE